MTPSPSHFSQALVPSPLPGAVVANNDVLPVRGQGDVTLLTTGEKPLKLQKTQLVPGLNGPLLSAGALAKGGYQLVFGDDDASSFLAKKGALDQPLIHFEVQDKPGGGVL